MPLGLRRGPGDRERRPRTEQWLFEQCHHHELPRLFYVLGRAR